MYASAGSTAPTYVVRILVGLPGLESFHTMFMSTMTKVCYLRHRLVIRDKNRKG
jgi:hypothetical protein